MNAKSRLSREGAKAVICYKVSILMCLCLARQKQPTMTSVAWLLTRSGSSLEEGLDGGCFTARAVDVDHEGGQAGSAVHHVFFKLLGASVDVVLAWVLTFDEVCN